ncbi:MAG: hypothetical protein HYU69_10730 [Bacteroidetes bacterium]|nr:hypothetical protein [Bacteroidota bacterium]
MLFSRSYVDAHSCFTELASHLAQSGYMVDLYCIFNPYNSPPLFSDSKIRVLNFPRSKFERAEFWYRLSFKKEYKYNAVIGTPFEGAFLAEKISRRLGIPFIYLADEVFNTDLKRHEVPNYKKLKKSDIIVNQKADASIALGIGRYEYQRQINRLPLDHKYFVIPNSPSGRSVRLRSNYFRDIFNITDQKPLILFIGTLGWNLAKELFEKSNQFRDKPYHLVFHSRTLGLMGTEIHPFIKLSQKPVPSTMLNYIVSSADVGLILYDKDEKAERENALTGGKIGTYLKNNLPVIAGNVEDLRTIEEKGMGVYISKIDEFESAVLKIADDPESYRRNIENVYSAEYDFSAFYKEFESFLSNRIH